MKTGILGKIPAILIAVILAVSAMVITNGPVYGATGSYSIHGSYANPFNGVLLSERIDFSLYKIGEFHGSTFEREEALSNVGVDIPVFTKKGDRDEEEWTEEWLECANSFSAQLPDGYDPVSTAQSDAASPLSSFDFTGLEGAALYLLTGSSQIVPDAQDADKSRRWTPRPMFVMILNDDAVISLKFTSVPVTKRYAVMKSWKDAEHEDKRPEKIEIEALYDGKVDSSISPIKLPDGDNEWYFEFETEKVNKEWTFREVVSEAIKYNYEISVSEPRESTGKEGDPVLLTTITNTYSRPTLEITKKLPDYVDHGNGTAAVLGFEITGFALVNGEEEAVYHVTAGMTMGADETEKTIEVKDIPRGLTRVVVEESYSGNYAPVGERTKTATFVPAEEGPGKYTVEFENKYDNPSFTGGVINRYSKVDTGAYEVIEQINLLAGR